jgi:hypothetical protein
MNSLTKKISNIISDKDDHRNETGIGDENKVTYLFVKPEEIANVV